MHLVMIQKIYLMLLNKGQLHLTFPLSLVNVSFLRNKLVQGLFFINTCLSLKFSSGSLICYSLSQYINYMCLGYLCLKPFYQVSFQFYFSTTFVSLQPLCMSSNVRLTSTFMKIGSSISIPQNMSWILMNMSHLIGFPKTLDYFKTTSSNSLLSVYYHY